MTTTADCKANMVEVKDRRRNALLLVMKQKMRDGVCCGDSSTDLSSSRSFRPEDSSRSLTPESDEKRHRPALLRMKSTRKLAPPALQRMKSVRNLVLGCNKNNSPAADDDATTTSHDEMLVRVNCALAAKAEQEEELARSMRGHVDLAKARLSGGNTVGAILSMRKVNRLQEAQSHVASTMSALRALENEIKISTSSEDQFQCLCASLVTTTEPRDFKKQLETILSRKSTKKPLPSDEELQAELAGLMLLH